MTRILRDLTLALLIFGSGSAVHAALSPLLDGEYRVPVGDPNLESSATYAVRNMSWSLKAGELSLTYLLPIELTGRMDSEIILRGPNAIKNGEFRLKGDLGQAHCEVIPTKPKEEVRCRIDYKNLQFDPAAREDYLRVNYPDPADLQARLQVARDFEMDPIGVLSFKP